MRPLAGLLLLLSSSGAKLPPATAKEMADAVIAVDKALGLESWGEKPCVDRGSVAGPAKDVSLEDTRKCATAALGKGFGELGKSYVIGVLMAPVGPMTVIAIGTGPASGWGAYSCDPGKKCQPLELDPKSRERGRFALSLVTEALAPTKTT